MQRFFMKSPGPCVIVLAAVRPGDGTRSCGASAGRPAHISTSSLEKSLRALRSAGWRSGICAHGRKAPPIMGLLPGNGFMVGYARQF